MSQLLWLFGSRLNIVADHTTTAAQYDLIEGYFPPGTQTPLHRHTRYSEQLYVLEGEFTVWAGENKVVLSAGESFLIPVGTAHVVAVLSDKPARGLVVAAPSGFARLIAAVGTLNEAETPDMELAERVSAEIGDEILGPPGTLPADLIDRRGSREGGREQGEQALPLCCEAKRNMGIKPRPSRTPSIDRSTSSDPTSPLLPSPCTESLRQ